MPRSDPASTSRNLAPGSVPASSPVAALRQRLETERRTLLEEIQAYPAPITACDVQFNTLLLRRGRLGRALQALQTLAESQAAGTLKGAALEDRLRAITADLEADAPVGHASVFVG